MSFNVSHVSKSFGQGDTQTQVLKDVCFEASFGEMLYIVGPSGSGKTTLLSILSGILKPDQGEIIVKGTAIWKLQEDQLADFRLHSIGFVFQDFHLFPKITSLENVAIPLVLQKMDWNQALTKAESALKTVGLGEKIDVEPCKLSVGQQQRVAIARAIVSEPEILILDEPTASLDGDTGKKIISFIKDNLLNEKRLIIVVTHDNRIEEYATRIIKLEDGCLVDQGVIR